MRVYVGLIMLARVLSPGFLVSYWSAEFGRFLQVSAFTSHWLEDCANFTTAPKENDQPLVVQYEQQANILLSMPNYPPLVISGNKKK